MWVLFFVHERIAKQIMLICVSLKLYNVGFDIDDAGDV